MRKLLWIILLASAVFTLPQIKLRILNEINNNSVLLAADYSEFTSKLSIDGQLSSAVFERLKQAGIKAFILRASDSVSSKDAGFNPALIEKLRDNGFEIIVHLNTISYPESFYDNLDRIIGKYSIEYILLHDDAQNSKAGIYASSYPDTGRMSQIVHKHNLLIFIVENSQQTGYVKVLGSDELITSSGYNISRAYVLSDNALASSGLDDVPYIWMRAVVERNVRLIWIKPLTAAGREKDYTFEAVSKLTAMLSKKSIVLDSPAKPLNNSITHPVHGVPVIINLAAAFLIYFSYLFPRWKMPCLHQKITLSLIVMAVIIIAGPITVICWTSWGSLWAAFLASIIYPSLSGLLMLRLVDSCSGSFISLTARSLLTLILVSCIGALAISASMSDIRYTMHLKNYTMVIPSYILPLISFNANMLLLSHKHRKPSIMADALYTFVLLLIMSIYLARSGNFNILPVFPAELEARKLLEITMTVRPRWKELLIGYPCMFAFIYLYSKKVPFRFLCLLGTLSTITAVSILNSFCHGFTPVITSASRSANGLLLGLITGTLAVLFTAFVYNVCQKERPAFR